MENTKKVAANAATAFIANGDLRLSDHFKLREFTLSGAAIRYNLDNTPTTVEVERLRALCVNVLEPLRCASHHEWLSLGAGQQDCGWCCKVATSVGRGGRHTRFESGGSTEDVPLRERTPRLRPTHTRIGS